MTKKMSGRGRSVPSHVSDLGAFYVGDSIELLQRLPDIKGKVQLLITSPPFPLNHKKAYGNLTGNEYLKWFANLAEVFSSVLAPDGSVVMEIGNAWVPQRPIQSLLPMESLLAFAKNERAGLNLCQEFVCYNPARLPSPAQWVTVERMRLTDSYTHVWWFAKSDKPKADNRKVLRPYSGEMKKLLKKKKYNVGKRPSQHHISATGFLTDNGGSIAQNFFELEPLDPSTPPRLPNAMRFGNTGSNSDYLRRCRDHGVDPHPARMAPDLVSFFVNFLTDEGDLVLDPFAGSNTTGFVAEELRRKWVSIEVKPEYEVHSRLRLGLEGEEARSSHA